MSELMCPFLPWDSWHNEFEGPCVVVKGDHCEVYQQLAERDNRIAELEKELEKMRAALRNSRELEERLEKMRAVAISYRDVARQLQDASAEVCRQLKERSDN